MYEAYNKLNAVLKEDLCYLKNTCPSAVWISGFESLPPVLRLPLIDWPSQTEGFEHYVSR